MRLLEVMVIFCAGITASTPSARVLVYLFDKSLSILLNHPVSPVEENDIPLAGDPGDIFVYFTRG